MKKILIIILFFSGIFAQAQYQVKTKLILENEQGQKFDKLICGIHEFASDSVDLELGENYDLPPNPPQSQMYGYFTITNPRTKEKTSSYLDLRPVKDIPSNYIKFNFRCQRGLGEKLYISWAALSLEKVDSAFITDVVTENIIRIDMVKKDSCIIDNSLINQFYMQVWYNGNINSVIDNENNTEDYITIANNVVMLDDFNEYSNIKLVDINGNILLNNIPENIYLDNYNNGLYFLVITKNDGTLIRKKVLKF